MKIIFLHITLIIFFLPNFILASGTDSLITYPGIGDSSQFKSDIYKLFVKKETDTIYTSVFIYKSNNDFLEDIKYYQYPTQGDINVAQELTSSNHWGSFSFSGTVEVKVITSQNPGKVYISPKSDSISVVVNREDNYYVVLFNITRNGQYYVNMSNMSEHPLFVFANPLEKNIPNLDDTNVIKIHPGVSNDIPVTAKKGKIYYFMNGVHTFNETYFTLNDDVTIYIDGGAFIEGLFNSPKNIQNVVIKGYGIISGVKHRWNNSTWTKHLIQFWSGNNNKIKGIVLTDPPKACIVSYSNKTVVDNVKMFGWHRNSDGVRTGNNSIIRNCFFKVNDDHIKLFNSNLVIDNNIIWQEPTGSIFQFSWKLQYNVNNIKVSNIDVIHCDRIKGTFTHRGNNAIFGCANIKGQRDNRIGAELSNYKFENINIEGRPYQIFGIQIHKTAYQNSGAGEINNIEIKNFNIEQRPRIDSYINGNGIYTGAIKNIKIVNMKIEEIPILHNEESNNGEMIYKLHLENKAKGSVSYFLKDTLSDIKLNRASLNKNFILFQNYPNPFNPITTIRYTIRKGKHVECKSQHVQLKVYDILGREVATFVNKEQSAGNYKVQFDASAFSSGVYYYQLRSGNFAATKKMIYLQ